MLSKLLLFDIDGTLLRTNGAGQRALATAGRAVLGDDCVLSEIDTSGKLDPQIFRELAEAHPHYKLLEAAEGFRDAYLEALESEVAAVEALPGVHDCLATLRTRANVTLGLLTGNDSKAVPLKLRAVGLEPSWFPITAFGDEADTRPDLVQLAMQKYAGLTGMKLEPQQVIVIGDTPRDVDCAQVHGCVAFAVATGRWSRAELEATGADVVADDLRDLTPLLNLL